MYWHNGLFQPYPHRTPQSAQIIHLLYVALRRHVITRAEWGAAMRIVLGR